MVSCILLAAGESRRFGSPKPLAKIGPKTLIEISTARLLKTQVLETVVVLGASANEIQPLISGDPRVKTVLNRDYLKGQTSSFKKGLISLSAQSKGVMLLPIDVPFIKNVTLDLLMERFSKEDPLLLIPTFNGKKGHPPIFSSRLFHELANLGDDEPLYTLQRRHALQTLLVPVEDKGVTLSFNTPEEFNKIK